MTEVKIVDFSVFGKGKGEQALTQLVNQGWQIAAAGGGGSFPNYIVILQRDDRLHRGEGSPSRDAWDLDPTA